MRDLRVAALLLLLLATALAGVKEASALTTPVDKWVLSGETITVEGQSFTIYLSSRTNQVLADYGKGSLFITNNSCESTDIARICLDNVQYDYTDKVTKVRIRGVSLAPSMTITRTASKAETIVGDEILFTVKLSNAGGLARNMTYLEIPPKEFVVTETDGLKLVPARAEWKGKLDEGESVSFSYKLKALSAFDGSLVASLSYNLGSRIKAVYSSTQALKVTPAVVLYAGIGSATALVGERNNLTVNVTNRLSETAVMAPLEVVFDPGIKVTSRPYEFKAVTPWSYVWNGEVPRVYNQTTNVTNLTGWLNITKSWFFEFKGTSVGTSDMRARASYRTVSNPEITAVPEKKQSVVVSNKEVIVRTSLKEVTMEKNQRKRLKVWLQNLNPHAELRNVHANISTGLVYIPDAFLGKMGAGEQVLLADEQFYAPVVNSSTGYVIATNVSYFTEYGDNFSKNFKDTATVVPAQDVTLSQTVSSTTAKAGEEIEVAVTVKNLRPTNLKRVVVSDNVSPEFSVIGKNQAMLDVPSKGLVAAYTYKLKVAHIGRGKDLHVNTTMRYSDSYNSDYYLDPQDYEVTKATIILVEPESLPLSISRSVDDASTYAGQVFTVKYTITNKAADKTAKNVVLRIPLAYGLDLVDSEEAVRISHLGPAESVILANAEKRRAKFAGDVDFPKAVLEYENIYGDKFVVNGSAITLPVKENYIRGPVILLEKLAPGSANNTDSFSVQLKVANTGTEPVEVLVDDDGKKHVITVQNRTEYVINKSARYPSVGKFELPEATASYASGNVVFRTASKPASIEIFDNPVLGIVKEAPSNVSNIEPYAVLLRLDNKAPKPIRNVTVSDGDRKWQIDEIPGGGQANMTYQDTTASVGQQSLGAASATYLYESAYYAVKSNAAAVTVAEKSLITVSKEIIPSNATKGDKVKVKIAVKNRQDAELDVLVADGEKSFSVKLPPNGEEEVGYDTPAGESAAGVASATYAYNGQQLTALSQPPLFTLTEEKVEVAKAGEKVGKEAGEEGILSKLIKALLGVLTWKRGG